MCNWCIQHGDGKKWYLNIKNYSKDFLNDEAVVEAANTYFQHIESIPKARPADNLNIKTDEEFSQMVESTKQFIATYIPHRGQVVPIEDVKEIIKLAGPMAKMACACRRIGRANFEDQACIAVGPVYLEYAKEWPDYTRGGID